MFARVAALVRFNRTGGRRPRRGARGRRAASACRGRAPPAPPAPAIAIPPELAAPPAAAERPPERVRVRSEERARTAADRAGAGEERPRAADSRRSKQEIFDFGQPGATFQLPPVSPAQGRRRPAERRARRARRSSARTPSTCGSGSRTSGSTATSCRSSPGPVITSYEFEPAAGRQGEPGGEPRRRPGARHEGGGGAHHRADARARHASPSRCRTPSRAIVYLREIFVSPEFARVQGPAAARPRARTRPATRWSPTSRRCRTCSSPGATGSGKSVGLNTMICSILYKATPAEVRFLMIDPEAPGARDLRGHPAPAGAGRDRREGGGRPAPVDRRQDGRALQAARRPSRCATSRATTRRSTPEERLPYWVVVVDELADLMMVSAGEVQNSLVAAGPDRPRGRHPPDHRHPAAVGRRGHRPHQGELPDAHRLPGGLQGGLAHRARPQRRRAAPGPRRHDLRAAGHRAADARARRVGRRRRGQGDVSDFLRKQGSAVYEEAGQLSATSGRQRAAAARTIATTSTGTRSSCRDRPAQASISLPAAPDGARAIPKAARFIDMMEQDRIIGPGDGAKPREILVGPEYLLRRSGSQ